MLLIVVTFTGCNGDDSAVQDYLTPSQMMPDPMSFSGDVSIRGTVGDYGRFNFSLYDDAGEFEIPIDYRGSQALPAMGTVIIATGQMNYRSCCGPHLIATRFEVAD